jgi:hypothetical protein
MTFCWNITVLDAKVLIISRRSSFDSIILKFVNAGIMLGPKSMGVELATLIALLK